MELNSNFFDNLISDLAFDYSTATSLKPSNLELIGTLGLDMFVAQIIPIMALFYMVRVSLEDLSKFTFVMKIYRNLLLSLLIGNLTVYTCRFFSSFLQS